MRQRPGKMRNPQDLRRRGTVHEVMPERETEEKDGERTDYVRTNCRRGDWATDYVRVAIPSAREMEWRRVYMFADEADAMFFRMRFG